MSKRLWNQREETLIMPDGVDNDGIPSFHVVHLPPPPDTALFTMLDVDFPERCRSLDVATPLFQGRLARLAEGQVPLIAGIVHDRASYYPGEPFQAKNIVSTGLQQSRISAGLSLLTQKGVLRSVPLSAHRTAYRFRNPTFELWMRMRQGNFYRKGSQGLVGSNLDPIFTTICPVIGADQDMSAGRYWSTLCCQAGTEVLPIQHYKRAARPTRMPEDEALLRRELGVKSDFPLSL